MNRDHAEQTLQKIFGHARFHDEQWQVIERLMAGERILMVEKTGFGKSLCYQFPATQLSGTTVVFSPLIALMRDQLAYLQLNGIAAGCINSEQDEETNTRVLSQAKQGQIKLLYIAPERQENQAWLDAVRNINLAMVVIDEAHCISEWGHDFRPAFRRIVNLVRLLPTNFPILATTATATERVANDVIRQMGGQVRLVRGNLLRENFRLAVIRVDSEEAKFAWLAEFLPLQNGTGIVYAGTRANTELFANWLQRNGFAVSNYNAGLDAESRKEIEKGLKKNRFKCVVSTNALGMGIDKPDIRFIVHTQMPASLIHYYQEIGRAGRDGEPSRIVLLYNPADKSLPMRFIKNSRPEIRHYERVIATLRQSPLHERELITSTNLTGTQIQVICSDLLEQGLVQEVRYGRSKKYELKFGAPKLDTKPFEELRQFKLLELDKMSEYAEAKTGGMKYLCAYLGDDVSPANDECVRRSYVLKETWRKRVREFHANYFPPLEVATAGTNLVNGVAASFYGFSNVGAVIHHCKYEHGGDFPDLLVQLTLKAFKSYFVYESFDLIMYVPPTESGSLVKNFAKKIAQSLGISISHGLKKAKTTEPQKVFQNSVLKRDNVKDAFIYEKPDEITGASILLIDDICDSGATIKEIGMMLTTLGAVKIAPLVIAKTIGNMPNDKAVSPSQRQVVALPFSQNENVSAPPHSQIVSPSTAAPIETKTETASNSAHEQIVSTLKQWRAQKAKEKLLPTYCFISTDAINDLARRMPKNIVELLEVKGIGKSKAKKYGEEILKLLGVSGDSHVSQTSDAADLQKSKPSSLQRLRRHYPNAYKSWTPEEDKTLLEMVEQKKTSDEIAKYFGRKKGAIHSRFNKLTGWQHE